MRIRWNIVLVNEFRLLTAISRGEHEPEERILGGLASYSFED